MTTEKALRLSCVATLVVAFIEFLGGRIARSLALTADAAHMLTDAGALGLAFFAAWVARQPATRKMSYGFHRVEILAALVNGVALVTLALFLIRQAFFRFAAPLNIRGDWMLAVGGVGLAFNLLVAIFLSRYVRLSINVRGALYHVLADLLGSVGVVAAGFIVWKTGWAYADPVVGLGIAFLIIWGAWQILRSVVVVLLEATPARVDMDRLERRLLALPGVAEICDLHVWTITSGRESLSAHLAVGPSCDTRVLLEEINALLSREFGIHHTTIQFEEAGRKPHRPHETHS